MSEERSISSDHSSIDLHQSYSFSLNITEHGSERINLNELNLNESNSDFNEQINPENSDLSVIVDQTNNNQTVYFHPSFLQLNSSSQSNQPDSIELSTFNNATLSNNQVIQRDQINSSENQINSPNNHHNSTTNQINSPSNQISPENHQVKNNTDITRLQIQNLNSTAKSSFHKSSFEWEMYNDRNKVLKELRENRKFIDIQLIAEDNYSEYAHSTVISALGKGLASFVLKIKQDPKTPCIIVESDNLKNHIKQIHLDGISGPVLKVIVNCAYTGYIETDDKQVIRSIIDVAERFAMNDVLKACCTYLIYQLNIDNCIKLLHLGIKFKHKLRTAAWNFIRLKFDRIVNECADYIHLSIDELLNLLEDDHLNTISGEQIVWLGICRWILADLLNRSKYLIKLLDKLRFGRLPLEYLEEVIVKEPLLIEINNGTFNENNNTGSSENNNTGSNENSNTGGNTQLASLKPNTSSTNQQTKQSIVESKSNELIAFKAIKQPNELLLNSTKLDQFEIKKLIQENSSSSSLNFDHTSKCLNLVKRMICIRKNRQNQYKTDNRNLLVDLNPYFVRPRVPAEVIFVIGGWQENMITTIIETYDVRTNMWLESHISLEYTRAYHGLEVLNGLLYVIGGTNGNKTLSSMHCFNPNNGKWYERANMYERRCYVNTTILNDLIYAMGGHNGAQRLNTVEKYDYKTNQWIQSSPMNLARSDASAVTYDNKIYIAGGLNEHVQNTVEFYNPIDDTWTFIQPMQHQRNSLSLVLYSGCLFALGGTNGSSRLNTVEKYDFETKVWTISKSMRCCRSTFSACVLEDKLYVVGGHDLHSQLKSVECYDIQTDQWYEVKNLKRSRSGFNLCCYKSFTVSNRYTYNYHTEQQLMKNKKNMDKKKEAIKKSTEINLTNQPSNRINRKDSFHLNFPTINLNQFRRRRNQFRLNSSHLINQRNLRNIELSRTNNTHSNLNLIQRELNNRINNGPNLKNTANSMINNATNRTINNATNRTINNVTNRTINNATNNVINSTIDTLHNNINNQTMNNSTNSTIIQQQNLSPANRQEMNYFDNNNSSSRFSEQNIPFINRQQGTETIVEIDSTPSYMIASTSRDEPNMITSTRTNNASNSVSNNNASTNLSTNLSNNLSNNLSTINSSSTTNLQQNNNAQQYHQQQQEQETAIQSSSRDSNQSEVVYQSTSQLHLPNIPSLTVIHDSSSSTTSSSDLQIVTRSSNHSRSYEQMTNRNQLSQFFQTRSLNNERLVDREDEPTNDMSNNFDDDQII